LYQVKKAMDGGDILFHTEEEMCMGGAIFTGMKEKNEFPPEMLTMGVYG